MKIALAQINYHIGNFERNYGLIEKAIKDAGKAGAELVVFAELAVCGYPPRDFLESENFIDQCEDVIKQVTQLSSDIGVIIGSPSRNADKNGKKLFNSAYLLYQQKVQAIVHKTLIPNYDVFDEYRYFEPNREFKMLEFKGHKIALTICEDLWYAEDPIYTVCPMDHLMKGGPEFILNISASPFAYDHARERIDILKRSIKKYKIPIIYSNQVGSQTELIFDGGSLVLNAEGTVVKEMPYFKEALEIIDLEELKQNTDTTDIELSKEPIPLIHDALIIGISDYFQKLGLSDAIIGLSGGIDSAVVAVLAQKALGAEHVRLVLMPSPFSTEHSVDDAKALAEKLACPHEIIPIGPIYESYLATLKEQFEGTEFNVAEENLQARARGNIVMAISNKFGHILLNSSNKSEIAVGYGTLYGDLSGGISILGDVYKTQVYQLAKHMNKDEEVIPNNILVKPPSAELSPGQKDSDSLPDYDILDQVLYQYIEKGQDPEHIILMGFEKELVDRILNLVNSSEFKRYQTPPILRVSSKAFGMGRRMPIVARYPG